MRFITTFSTAALSLLVVLLLAPGAGAQMGTAISGTLTATYTQLDTVMVSQADMHMMTMGISGGANKCTSENMFMEGAKATNMSFSDLTKGNGPHQGYVKFEKDGDSAMAKWAGKVTTTMSAEGTPMTSFEGNFKYISGTGELEGIKGQGTFKGSFTSPTSYSVEWQGEYTAGK
jgi:hypothetical protein